jgi:hypothetical protein
MRAARLEETHEMTITEIVLTTREGRDLWKSLRTL